MKIIIEITDIERISYRVDEIKGVILICIEDNIETILFDIFRPYNNLGDLNLRIYKNDKSVIIDEFKNKFYSADFDNRKIIKWLGENIVNIMNQHGK